MRAHVALLFIAACCAATARGGQPQPTAAADAPLPSGRLMTPEKVTDHIWVMRQPDRLWSAVIGNVEIIEQSDGVVLVDSGGTIADGRDVVAAVAKLTPKPIKAVIITHWHNDHPLGVPGILERFPKARIIATEWTKRLMGQVEVLNTGIGHPDPKLRDNRLKAAEERAAVYRKSADDPALPMEVRRQYAIEAAWVLERVQRQLANYVVLPTETFTELLTIDDPVAPVEALFLGRGNTRGDALAWLPRQKVMISGDIVVLPTPYGFSDTITQPWMATLDRMEKYDFHYLVPGHGRVQRDRAYLATLRWSVADIRRQAGALAKTPATAEDAARRFDRSEQRRRFGASDPWTKRWLDEYWLDGMFETAFKQARGLPLQPGVDGGD